MNRTFLTRLGRFANDIRLGEDLQVDANGVELALTALRKGVQSIDARTAAKFKLALFP